MTSFFFTRPPPRSAQAFQFCSVSANSRSRVSRSDLALRVVAQDVARALVFDFRQPLMVEQLQLDRMVLVLTSAIISWRVSAVM